MYSSPKGNSTAQQNIKTAPALPFRQQIEARQRIKIGFLYKIIAKYEPYHHIFDLKQAQNIFVVGNKIS